MTMAMKGLEKEKFRKWMLPAVLIGLAVLAGLNLMKRSDTKRVRVVFPDGGAVVADVADSPEEHILALFVADRLKEGQGVLLMYEESGLHGLWTRNIRAPVDLVWIDPMHQIVRIDNDVKPCRSETCETLRPERAILYLLETPPGMAARHGLENGATLDFKRLSE